MTRSVGTPPPSRHILAMSYLRPGRLLRVLAVAGFAVISTAAAAAPLSEADGRDVARVEAYLNTISSVKARFLQRTTAGELAEGWLYLRRPNRIRLDYRPPAYLQIYARGYWLAYVDTEMEEITHVPLESTPAGFLVRDPVRLSGDITVVRVERGAGALRLHVVQTEEPEAGRVVLTFQDAPMRLRNWTVIDAQGAETRVSLLDPQFNVALDDALFEFDETIFNRP